MTDQEKARGRKYVVRYSPFLDAFRLVLKDIRSKGIQGRAVINLSMGFPDLDGKIPAPGDDDWELYEVIRDLIAEKVVIVVASGNSGIFRGVDPTQPPNPVCTLHNLGICSH